MKLNTITFAIISLGFSQVAIAEPADNEPEASTQAELQTVTVKGKAAKAISEATNSYQRDRVNLGLLGRQNAFTAPITAVNYDEKAFEDIEPRTIVDVIAKTDASVMAFGGESNTLQGLYVRGLQLDARQFSVNGLAGLYSTYNSPTAAVGAAQLIKGASSATVGMDPEGAVGSAVNIETKKASDEGNRNLGLAWFSDSRIQPSIDVGQRFGENKQWGVRFNGKFREGDTARDHFSENAKEAALNVDYRGEKFQAAFDAMYAKRATQGGRARFQDIQLFGFKLPAAPDGKTNLAPAWQRQTTDDRSLLFTFDYMPNDWVAISGGIGHMESKFYGNVAQLQMLDEQGNYQNGAWNNTSKRFVAQGAQPVSFIARTTSANLKARGYFQTGPVSHNWNTAFDYVQRSRDHDTGRRASSTLMTDLNIYHPEFPAAPEFATADIQGADTTNTSPSWAFSDTLGFKDDQFRLTLGGRLQWMKQEDHTVGGAQRTHRFSPLLAAAWVPSSDFVVYGNYLEDLEPGAVDEDGNMSRPRISRQIELGVRKNWGDVVTSASVYQISKPGYWRTASTFDGLSHVAGATQGKERNRGIELNAYANLLNKTLRPSIGLSYIKADLLDVPSYNDVIISGTQVSSPRIIAKAGVEWDTPFVQGLTLNSAVQYYGKSYQDYAKTYAFPSYTLVDAGAKYTVKMRNKQSLTLNGGIENLLNKKYWQVQRGLYDRSFAVVGLPRTYWLKLNYAF